MTGNRAQATSGESDGTRWGSPGRISATVATKVGGTVTAGKTRVQGTPAADLASDLKDADLINRAMNFAALVLMIFFPFVITLSSLSPLNHGGAADVIVRKMGLSSEAAVDVEKLFNTSGGDVVVNGWTFMGFVWLVIGGAALAAALAAIYREIWALPSPGFRGFAGQALWLGLLVLVSGVQMLLGDALTGGALGQIGYAVLAFLILVTFLWAGPRVLLLGRLSWHQLLPTAVFTAIGLTGLGFFSKLFFSSSIVSNEKIYGSIGVVFIILSWLIGIGVVVTGGAIVGSWYVGRDFSFLRWLRRRFGRRAHNKAVSSGHPARVQALPISSSTFGASDQRPKEGEVGESIDVLGPVDWIVVEFPGSKFTGEMAPILDDLVDRGLIRILDLLILKKDRDGSLEAFELSDLDDSELGELRSYETGLAMVLSEQDVSDLAATIEPGSSAGVLVWENLWAAPFASAVRHAGGQLVASGRIPTQAVIAAVESDMKAAEEGA